MKELMDVLGQAMGGDTMRSLGRSIGSDDQKTQAAVGAGLQILMGALARNASDGSGAEKLSQALQRDHDGSVLDGLSSRLQQQPDSLRSTGEGILRHVLGNDRGNVERRLGQATGLDSGSVGQLLSTLAPVVLGSLGKAQREGGLDSGGLAGMLRQQVEAGQRREPAAGTLLSKVLDADGDGDIKDDLGRIGGQLLGKFLGGGR